MCRALCPGQSLAVKRRGGGGGLPRKCDHRPSARSGKATRSAICSACVHVVIGRASVQGAETWTGQPALPDSTRRLLAPASPGFGIGRCLRGRVGQCRSVELSAVEDEEVVLCPFRLSAWLRRMMLASETGHPRFKFWLHRLLIPGLIIVFRSPGSPSANNWNYRLLYRSCKS